MPESSVTRALRSLMKEHGLIQSYLPEIVFQGMLSEILRGKRKLNLREIGALAKRFHLGPVVFIFSFCPSGPGVCPCEPPFLEEVS